MTSRVKVEKEEATCSSTTQKQLQESSVKDVISGMLNEFALLLILATAFPVAYWIMQNWLDNFAYRIDLKVWMYIVSAFVALAVAMMTVSYQSIKADQADPIECLRYE